MVVFASKPCSVELARHEVVEVDDLDAVVLVSALAFTNSTSNACLEG